MNKFNSKISTTALAVTFALGLLGPVSVLAATTPSLGVAGTYGILSNLFQHNIAATTITGDPANALTVGVLGYSSEAGVGAMVVVNGTTYVNDATWTAAGVAQNAALNNAVDGLNVQACTSVGATVDLSLIDTDGPGGLAPGTFPPGCYSSTGAMDIGSTITLSGSGTYIFRPNGALNTASGSIVTLSGASACNIFWAPTQAATLGANSTFVGTIIDPSGVTMSNLAAVTGRILAYGGTVTADSNNVTVPVCAAPTPTPTPASGGASNFGSINVVKLVINDSGGTKTIADFPLFVNGTPVVSGVTNDFSAPASV
ncbi:MAG: ice-binding family protein, partial [bacterium]|nr:ice-binding family protein [bacterium]